MDNFGKGAIILAVLIAVFILWGGLDNEGPKATTVELVGASLLPLVLVLTVFLFWWLQKGET